MASAASNPFLSALASMPTGNDPVANSIGSMPSPVSRGVDLSNYAGSLGFSETPNDFANAPGNPTLPGASAAAPSSHPGGLGGFFSGLVNNVVKPVYNDLSGGLQGYNSDLYDLGKTSPTMLEKQGPFGGLVEGLLHPGVAHQNYSAMKQGLDASINNPFQKWATNTFYDTASDPLTYIPVAGVAKVAGITPALKFGSDLLKGTVKGADVGKAASESGAQAIAQATKKTGGFASPLTDAQAKAMNEWAGLSGGYVKPDVPAWEYNYANPLDVLNGAHPTTADKIAPLLQGLNKDQSIPELLGGGKLTGNMDQIRKLGSQAVQSYADLAGLKPLMGSTAKGATLDALKQSFSDMADKIANLSHTAEPIVPQENGFVLRGGPLMVIPQTAKDAADSVASQASKIGPYANYAWQSKIGAPIAQALTKAMPNGISSSPKVAKVANALLSAFQPINGARQSFVNAVSKYHGTVQSGANDVIKQLSGIFAGTTPEQRQALTHALESTAPGTKLSDPVLENLRQQVEPLMEKATQTALRNGLIKGTINPAEFDVARYVPHISASKLGEESAPFSDISTRKVGVDAGKSRSLSGPIQALNATLPHDQQFETDMAKILAYHLGQANKSVAVRDLIENAMKNGIATGGKVSAGDIFPGTLQKAAEYSHEGNTVLLPSSEADFLKNINAPPEAGAATRQAIYRGGVNALNHLMFLSNPLIHVVNNLGTQTTLHDPAIFAKMPKYMKEAFTGVEPGSQMDQALKSGAMHLTTEIGKSTSAKDMANNLVKSIDKQSSSNPIQSGVQGLLGAFKHYNGFTPNMEKAYRAAAFERGLEKGMTPEESTNWVRSMYGGTPAPGTASPFDTAMTAAMPFFNWTKTAIGSNVRNALQKPAPYVAGYHALNDYNQTVTGHDMSQNPNPISVALPWKDATGKQEYYTPYAPPFDVAKLGKDIAQNGVVGGTGDFAFSRFNPAIKYAGQMLTHEQNPFAQQQNKYPVDQYYGNPLVPSAAHDRGILFGDKGPMAPAALAQLLQDTSNPISDAMQVGGQSTPDALLSKLLGGSVSAPNPSSQAKEQKYQQSQWRQQYKSWIRKQSQQGK